jgi:replicative DNA helicase
MAVNPLDVELEILAAIMFEPAACTYAFEHLKKENFINKKHGELYESMLLLHEGGDTLDPITLTEKTKHGDLITDCMAVSYSANRIKSHTNILLDRWYMLKAREKLIEAVKKLDSPERSPEKLRQSCEELAFFLADRVQDKGLQHVREISKTAISGLESIKKGNFPGVMTGFKALDELGFYFRNKTCTVIAARPGMGKSAFALKIAQNCPGNVAVYSLEMANEEQYERLISMRTALSNNHLKQADTISEYTNEIMEASIEINKQKIWINDSPKVSTTTMRNQCKRLQAQEGLSMIIVDYLGLAGAGKKYDTRREEVGGIMKELKGIAHELDIPVIPLAQLNRNVEERGDKRPILSDLRESGDIEQDAHMIWFLYRGEVYGEDEDDPEKAEVIVRKNRAGPTGSVFLTYKKESTNFVDYIMPPPKVTDTKQDFGF